MKQILIYWCLTIGIFNSHHNYSTLDATITPLTTFVDSLFRSSIDRAEIAGGAIMIVQNEETLVNKAYGYASLELAVPMPIDAKFEIGSVTKQFTAAAILKLVEEGKLSLEDDFTKYLEFDTKGRKVTINNLLNHTSGIPSYTEMDAFWDLSIEEHDRDSLVRLVEQHDFLFEPNEAMIYNNSAYFFLGLIIEKLSGQSYESYLQEHFFDPVGMPNTYYCSNTAVINNKAYGYNYSPDGLQQKPYLNHLWPYAAGSLCSTTGDLYAWMKALHHGQIFSNNAYQSLITPGALKNGSPLRYAKGLLNYDKFGYREISHGGGIHGFLSETRYFPEKDLYIICLINTTGPKGASYFAEKITWQLLEKREYQSVPIDLDAKTLEGTYSGAVRGGTVTVQINAIPNSERIGLDFKFGEQTWQDTLNTYIGNHTWMDGSDKFIIRDNTVFIDELSGYYLLKKE